MAKRVDFRAFLIGGKIQEVDCTRAAWREFGLHRGSIASMRQRLKNAPALTSGRLEACEAVAGSRFGSA